MGVYAYGVSRRTKKIKHKSGKTIEVAKTNFFGAPPSIRTQWDAEDGCSYAKRAMNKYKAFRERSQKIAAEMSERGIKFMMVHDQMVKMTAVMTDAAADKHWLAYTDEDDNILKFRYEVE